MYVVTQMMGNGSKPSKEFNFVLVESVKSIPLPLFFFFLMLWYVLFYFF